VTLSVVVPCFNEERTLGACVARVLEIQDAGLSVEIIVVDDGSRDSSPIVADRLAEKHREVRVVHHPRNQGKGAALRTGFRAATGDFVAVQDADLEYDPMDLRRLLEPLRSGRADVVLGSRFLGSQPHRVLYFWHYLGNTFLTFLSNMFTDLNLSDMETGYKVFRRDVIQSIELEEERFGFEPEIVAKIARRGLRIYETGISYAGRTYEDGKKIGWRDGVRALYCILRYNAHALPAPAQFLVYLWIGGMAALFNLVAFLLLLRLGLPLVASAPAAFVAAAAINYLLSIALLFRHHARWGSSAEIAVYGVVVVVGGAIDLGITHALYALTHRAWLAKSVASLVGVVFNFYGRRVWVFPERGRG
jgi:glycosyltransferase involved in cell wall biosynthesis